MLTWDAPKNPGLLGRLIEALDAKEILEDISRELAEEAVNLVGEAFSDQRSPAGAPWAPVKRPRISSGRRRSKRGKRGVKRTRVRRGRGRGGSAILVATGAMRNSTGVVHADHRGFTIRVGTYYAGFHQNGTKHMPARKMLPDKGTIPPAWAERFEEVAHAVLDDRFGDV